MAQSWTTWQSEVLRFLRADFEKVIQQIDLDDVDWNEWRALYNEGRDPRAAVNRAYGRDL